MKTPFKKSLLSLAIVTGLSLVGCSSDKSTESNSQQVINKSTSGVITGFGSVFINGVEYETEGATFTIDGETGDESMLKLGMVVSLDGSDNSDGTGRALSITFDDDVEGIVISNNIATDGTLNIMGLTIHVDDDTVFESKDAAIATAADIMVGNVIEVSGHDDGTGEVWATRLEVKKAVHTEGEEIEVKGKIATGSLTDTTFMVGDLTVNFESAILDDDFGGILTEGTLVEVKSELGIDQASGQLIASKIELKGDGEHKLKQDSDDDEVELEGVVTALVSATEIMVNGSTVIFDANTRFVHGDATTPALGLRIKVKGDVDANGALLAEKVIYKPTGDLKLAGKVESTDLVNNTVTVFGVAFSVNNATMVHDGKEDIKYLFGVDDLVAGDWVEIKAYGNADGGFTATKLQRKAFKEDKEEKLVGRITAIDAPNSQFVVAGITIDFSSLGTAAPAVGDKVEIHGSFVNGIFVATKGESADEDEHYIRGDDRDENDDSDSDLDDDDSKDDQDADKEEDDDDHEEELEGPEQEQESSNDDSTSQSDNV